MALWESEAIDTGFGSMTTAADPASSTATTTANVNQYTGVIITLTAAGNAQTIEDPTNTTAGRRFIVVNNDTSTDNIDVNGITLEPGEAQQYIWDGSAWIAVEAVDASDMTFTPAGDIAATNVQEAIEELDTEKAAKSITDWMFASTTTAAKSGAVTLTPATAANQISPVTGNITGLTCALSATYPYVIWTTTTDGNGYTLDVTGWKTDGGNSVTLTDTGTDSFVLYTPDGGTTKYFAKWIEAAA